MCEPTILSTALIVLGILSVVITLVGVMLYWILYK